MWSRKLRAVQKTTAGKEPLGAAIVGKHRFADPKLFKETCLDQGFSKAVGLSLLGLGALFTHVVAPHCAASVYRSSSQPGCCCCSCQHDQGGLPRASLLQSSMEVLLPALRLSDQPKAGRTASSCHSPLQSKLSQKQARGAVPPGCGARGSAHAVAPLERPLVAPVENHYPKVSPVWAVGEVGEGKVTADLPDLQKLIDPKCLSSPKESPNQRAIDLSPLSPDEGLGALSIAGPVSQ